MRSYDLDIHMKVYPPETFIRKIAADSLSTGLSLPRAVPTPNSPDRDEKHILCWSLRTIR